MDRETSRTEWADRVARDLADQEIREYGRRTAERLARAGNCYLHNPDTGETTRLFPKNTDARVDTASVAYTLAQRGARYGDFTDHAYICQYLQDVMREHKGWQRLSFVQKQALTVIADKIARILNGDPDYTDNWHDIQGYAKLAEDRCKSSGGL